MNFANKDNDIKNRLINLFDKNIKGKKPDLTGRNKNHDGKAGNWLEEQFGKNPDADNNADFWGYELKNETTSKTTFGDWSANWYIFKDPKFNKLFPGATTSEKQDSFCRIFGKPNAQKFNRYSWSGSPVPKIDRFNAYGQKLVITESLDIEAIYSFSEDARPNKSIIIPNQLQTDNIKLAIWFGVTNPLNNQKTLKEKLECKFNQKGWFTCKTNVDGFYDRIYFGRPVNYEEWINLVKSGIVFFDSGMYEGNKRPYSQWRANNAFWESLLEKD